MTEPAHTQTRVLLLGGTTEARLLAEHLADDQRFAVVVSLAGRTSKPLGLPVPIRTGGFGGIDGLGTYLATEQIDVVIDATHPFAAIISGNAVEACRAHDRPLIALERPLWAEQPGDRWRHFVTVDDAIAALPTQPCRVFSGLGRLSLASLRAQPQHHYVLRVIDPITEPLGLPDTTIISARGPFTTADDIALFKLHRIDVVIAKNAGGEAAVSKIDAARELSIPVHMITRPAVPGRQTVQTVDHVLHQLVLHHAPSINRGV
jgi:precorrin-6A/cobalt-precorrin-6A reductase